MFDLWTNAKFSVWRKARWGCTLCSNIPSVIHTRPHISKQDPHLLELLNPLIQSERFCTYMNICNTSKLRKHTACDETLRQRE